MIISILFMILLMISIILIIIGSIKLCMYLEWKSLARKYGEETATEIFRRW